MKQKQLAIAQFQVELITAQAGLKEYAADWLKEAKTVTRDTGGRFASKASEYIKDPKLLKKDVSTELVTLASDSLAEMVERNPEFTEQVLDLLFGVDAQQARDKLADFYEQINPDLPNAIKPDPFQELFADIKDLKNGRDPKEVAKDLNRALDKMQVEYGKAVEDAKKAASESEAIQALGKAIAASLPVASFLAVSLAPELAVGFLLRQTLFEILFESVISTAAVYTADKVLDATDIKNPWVRFGVELTASLGAMGTVNTLVKQNKKIAALFDKAAAEFNKKGGEAAEKLTYKLAQPYIDFIEELKTGVVKTKDASENRIENTARLVLGVALEKAPTQYLPFVKDYRNNFKESANTAKKLAKKMDWIPEGEIFGGFPENPTKKEAKQISVFVGGYDRDRTGSLNRAKEFIGKDGLFDDHHVVVVDNTKFNIPQHYDPTPVLKKGDKTIVTKDDLTWWGTIIEPLLSKGSNEQAIDVAARAYAYHLSHPEKMINLVGHSAGGMVTHEAAEILVEMGISPKLLKVVNLGSPYWGLTKKVCESVTFASKNDPLTQKVLVRDRCGVDSVTDHVTYLRDKVLRGKLRDFIDGKKVTTDMMAYEERVKLKQKALKKAMRIEKKLDAAQTALFNPS